MIDSVLLYPVKFAINQALRLDPESAERLQELNGACVGIKVVGLPWELFANCNEGSISLSFASKRSTNAKIIGPPLALLKSLYDVHSRKDLRVDGESRVAEQFFDLISRLDIDWEEALTRFMPDMLAHQLGNFVRDGQFICQASFRTSQAQFQEWVHEVVAITPYRFELEDYLNEVGSIQKNAAQLEQRVIKLKNNIKEN